MEHKMCTTKASYIVYIPNVLFESLWTSVPNTPRQHRRRTWRLLLLINSFIGCCYHILIFGNKWTSGQCLIYKNVLHFQRFLQTTPWPVFSIRLGLIFKFGCCFCFICFYLFVCLFFFCFLCCFLFLFLFVFGEGCFQNAINGKQIYIFEK